MQALLIPPVADVKTNGKPAPILVRLWNEVQQTEVNEPLQVVKQRPKTGPAPSPTRVRYAYD